jgi:His-Xaa-Ser system radical SAM maturase HxsB
MNLLPFNFERLDNGDYFLTNCAGYFTTLSQESLHHLADDDDELSSEALTKLKQGFFVSKEDSYESAVGAISSGLAKKISGELAFNPCFMIVPTLQCDHSCKYCQVSRAPLGQSQFDLDEQSIPEIVDMIKKLGSPPYKIEIQGGEPLVRFDLVEKIHSEAINKLGKNNFEFVVATSLSLLDEDVLLWAKANDNVCFSVSLDGDEVVHNSNRILHSGNSFDLAIRGIRIINETLGLGRVATVTTVTKSLLNSPQSIIDVHLNLDLHDMFVRPISPYGFASKNVKVEYTQSDYEVFYRTLWDLLKSINSGGERLVEHSALIHATRMLNPNYSQYADLKSPSGLLLNCILFNFDGKIFGSDEARMLQRVLPSVDFSIGTIKEPKMLVNELHTRILQDSFNIVHVGCETCAFQPYCGTDPCQNISVQGEPVGDKSKSAYCGYHKNMFKFLVQEYIYDGVTKSMIDGWLND